MIAALCFMLVVLLIVVYVGWITYGTIPRVATADGRERIPTETFSEIITKQSG